jgi:hypothetical protein
MKGSKATRRTIVTNGINAAKQKNKGQFCTKKDAQQEPLLETGISVNV